MEWDRSIVQNILLTIQHLYFLKYSFCVLFVESIILMIPSIQKVFHSIAELEFLEILIQQEADGQ